VHRRNDTGTVVAVVTMTDRHIVRRASVSEPWMPDDDLSLCWVGSPKARA
jgi:hypothetical protein